MKTGDEDERKSDSIAPRWIMILGIFGLLLILISPRMGKTVSPGEVLYDVGAVALTVALIELVLLRLLTRLSNPPEPDARLVAEVRAYIAKTEAEAEEWRKWLVETRLESAVLSMDRIERDLTAWRNRTEEELTAIRVRVDPDHARVIGRIDAAKDRLLVEKISPPPDEGA